MMLSSKVFNGVTLAIVMAIFSLVLPKCVVVNYSFFVNIQKISS